MLFNIVVVMTLVILYILTFYAGYNRANEKLNNDEPNAAMWGTIERICLAALCVVLIAFMLSMEFDVVTYYIKEILDKLEALTAHG